MEIERGSEKCPTDFDTAFYEDETSTCHLLSWILYLLFSNL